jgi:plastocyanin
MEERWEAVRLRKSYLWLAAGLGLVAAGLPAVAGSVEPTISAYNEPGPYGYHSWMPSTATVSPGGAVIFKNPYSGTPHGLKFTGGTAGPPPPSCTGLPAAAETAAGAPSWEAKCTFSKAGTYTFVCTVHPEMTGTITVTNGEPTVTTNQANPVTEHEATLNGTVNPNGKNTEYFFKWGPTEAYGEKTSVELAGAGTTGVAATATLSGLTPAATYHFRLVATNEKGTAEGPDQTFTTASPPGPPSATTGLASAVSETAATLEGTANPDGRPTEYFFEWGTTNAYGQTTAKVPIGQDHLGHAASAVLSSLSPEAVYHFRLVATNASAETAFGADQTFTTLSPPPPSPPPTTSPTTPTTPPPSTTPLVSFPPPKAPPVLGPTVVAGSLKLSAPRHSSSLRTRLEVAQAGAGGSLEVDVLVKGSLLGRARGSKPVRVARLLRQSVSAGKLSFSLALSAQAKRALAHRHSLALTIKITLTPPFGHTETLRRSLTLRA